MINHINNCIEKKDSKLEGDVLDIHGMTSPRIRHFLNNLLEMPGAKYMEAGLWKGATFISALYGNSPDYACGIDDWSSPVRDDFTSNCQRFIPDNSFDMLTGDTFSVVPREKINIFFYDASKYIKDVRKSLEYFYDYLDDEFIYIVDDFNLPEAKAGTDRVIKDLDFEVLSYNHMGAGVYNERATGDWWLGLLISILRK